MSNQQADERLSGTQSRVPFNLYDVFGYIIPGAYLALMLILVSFKSQGRLAGLIADSAALLFTPGSVLSSVFGFSIILVLCYMVGHMVATVSHVVFDRFVVGDVLTYPTEKVLRYGIAKNYSNPYIRSTYLYVYCMTIILLAFPAFSFLWDWRFVRMDADTCARIIDPLCVPKWYSYATEAVVLVIVVRVVAQFLSNLFGPHGLSLVQRLKVVQWGIWIYKFIPQYIFLPAIGIYESLIGTNRYFHADLIRQYETKFKKDFGLDPKTAKSENYWLPLIKIAQEGKAMNPSLTNWLQLYGFNRNMAAAGLLASFYCIWKLHIEGVPQIEFIAGVYTFNVIVLFAFMTRYWMLYVTYYTKSIIRAYLVD